MSWMLVVFLVLLAVVTLSIVTEVKPLRARLRAAFRQHDRPEDQ